MEKPQRLHDARRARLRLREQRDGGINALYPHARTFTLVEADVVGTAGHPRTTVDEVPRTLWSRFSV